MMHFPLTPKQEEIDARFNKEIYKRTAAILQSKGVPANSEKMYLDAINEYKANFREVRLYARSYNIPEYYKDFWIGVDGSTDSSYIVSSGLRVIAEYYTSQLEKTIIEVSEKVFDLKRWKRDLKDDGLSLRIRQELVQFIHWEEEKGQLWYFNQNIDREPIFSNLEHLRNTIFRIGTAHSSIFGQVESADDAESASIHEYEYLKGISGTAYLGKKQVWARMSEVCRGKEITEENYKGLWEDYGFFYARILDGEITDIAEI